MKKAQNTSRAPMFMVAFVVFTAFTYANTPKFQCYIDNDVSTTNTYEFDIKVKAESGTIKFSDFQFGLLVNSNLDSTGSLSAAIVAYNGPGGQGSISWDGTNSMIRLSVDTFPSSSSISTSCNTTVAIGTSPVAIYRIRLASSGTFSCVAPNIQFNFGNALIDQGTITLNSPWPTRIAFWASCSPVNDSDITTLGCYNSNGDSVNYAVSYYNSNPATNVYSGQSLISPYALNPAGTTYYADVDGDHFVSPNNPVITCSGPPPGNYYPIYTLPNGNIGDSTLLPDGKYAHYTILNGAIVGFETAPRLAGDHLWDCDDNGNPSDWAGRAAGAIYPGSPELCNGIDDNCNGVVDGDSASGDGLNQHIYYIDYDRDGFGNPAGPTIINCHSEPNIVFDGNYYALDNTDCNDDPYAYGSNIHVAPPIGISGSTPFCSGASASFHPFSYHTPRLYPGYIDDSLQYETYGTTSAYTGYLWSTGATTQDITLSSAGTYSVSVDLFGCTGTASITVTTVSNTSSESSATACDSYIWNSNTYTSSGDETFQTSNSLGCDSTVTLHLTIINPCSATVNLKLYIQGYYLGGGMMTPALMNEMVSDDPSVVDTILISLVDSSALSTNGDDEYGATVLSVAGILKTDGTMSVLVPRNVIGHKYYLRLNQRNAIETWSANTILFGTSTSYDFSTEAAKAYVSNEIDAYHEGIYSIYNGDVNQDQNVDIYDFPLYDYEASQFYYGYYAADLNGDGNVDIFDFPILDYNTSQFVSSYHP